MTENTGYQSLVAPWLQETATPAQPTCATEQAFKEIWHDHIATESLFNLALSGGLLADRLSWVFISAYQAAIRACFPTVNHQGWGSFAVSEDKTGEFPGTHLSPDNQLSGNKSWLAAAQHLDYLLVTIGPDIRQGVVLIRRDDPALDITVKPRARFLGDMSQGFACVTGLQVTDSCRADTTMARHFGMAEPFFVMTASSGYLLKEARRLQLPETVPQLEQLLARLHALYLQGFHTDLQQLAALYETSRGLGKQFAAASIAAAEGTSADHKARDWQDNGSLMGLYKRSIEARLSTD
ncbi:MAG: hypothetical protein KDI36_06145 [Pseudomonadales bacterium]|nr:hypothetical protein [Pseudomonadales bacterium]